MVGLNANGSPRDHVMNLIRDKERIEREISEETAVLQTNNIGMHEALVDAEGYPRNDIDVYRVRHARHRIICLRNDLRSVMKGIEQGLAEVHDQYRNLGGEGPSAASNGHGQANGHGLANGHALTNGSARANGHARANGDLLPNGHALENGHAFANGHSDSSRNVSGEEVTPFANVTFVAEGSPADTAGILQNDAVIQFGSVNQSNFRDVSQIMDLVAHSVGQPITVKVQRERRLVTLTVIPQTWAQPGLLGCSIQRSVD